MKNNIIRISLFGIVASFLVIACSKDFIDVEIVGKLSEDQFYKTDEDALQAVTAVYDYMQYEDFFSWYLLKTLPSDESNCSGSGSGDQPHLQVLDIFNWTANNGAIRRVWNQTYGTINRANLVINKTASENDLKTRLVAEAKTLRAYNYFELVSQWGDVPIILDMLAPSEFAAYPRVSKNEVYAQIAKDLTEAIPILPVKSQYSTEDKFRVSKGTAQAILGKAYLYQENWSKAVELFTDVVNSGEYQLEPNFAKIFGVKGEFGLGSIMETSFTNRETPFPWGRAMECNVVIRLMGIKAGVYTKAPGDTLIGGGWAFNQPRAKLYNAYINAGDVVRRIETLMSEAELVAKGGNWSNPDFWGYDGFIRRKYGTYSTETYDGISTSDYGTNWRLIRYSDVLLMLSEAYYRLGDEVNARLEINKVRARVQLGDITASGNALFEAIVTERQLELALEGHRYPDLIRWGLAAQELGTFGFTQGKHELLSIPGAEVRSAGLTQNPGY